MPPINKPSTNHYDLIVLGGGSGGMGASRRAAMYGKKAAVIESSGVLGGTCVNVGCVPKKIMWYASDMFVRASEASEYGIRSDGKPMPSLSFDWSYFVEKRDEYIRRLNGIYDNNLGKDNVDYFSGHGKLLGDGHVLVTPSEHGELKEEVTLTADHIVIATGGRPNLPSEETIPGAKLGTDSDGFFALRKQPKRAVVVGAGYIAVELACVLNGLGSETHLVIRHDAFLRNFDPIVSDVLMETVQKAGLHVHKESNVQKVEGSPEGPLKISLEGETIEADSLIWAIGRHPNISNIGMEELGIKTDKAGNIVVDKYQNTNVPNVYAIGDIQGKAQLTPVAIAAGRRLSNRLFGGSKFANDHLDYNNIPTAVFSHPPTGTVGLTEPQAREEHKDKKITIYRTRFTPMFYSMLEAKEPCAYKIVCVGEEEKVVGVHMVGMGSDETIQAIGIAVKMGVNKRDFDDTVAVHPTSAEELVTTFTPVKE
ncbi:glutathione-disulfide reductase [Malassezia vespertilionis]|uniref:Glutathione reductase n=1 Tax=Malassezia vespertilionis TaxID=2020962 RepID=A0A2N1J952_9BASI|nr:glutathione-disulfide reductase [Malassezia vespertilionis]PKI83085.1 Glr1p [Malassezia vespertilionis]WFD07681.1 glutathione-disulfide reductase [Malassezia vespertilionis]